MIRHGLYLPADPGPGGDGPGGEGGGGGGTPPAPYSEAAWPQVLEALPEDVRSDPTLRDIKGIEPLARSYIAGQRLVGIPRDRLLELPADPNDAEGMGKVFTRLGRPEAADKYEFKPVELPGGAKPDEGFLGAFRDIAHKSGLSQAQAAGLYEWWNAAAGAQLKANADKAAETHAANETALKSEWGEAYEPKRAAVAAVRGELAKIPGLDKVLDELGLETTPAGMRLLDGLAKQFYAEHPLVGGGAGGGGPRALSPAEAQQQIAALEGDDAFMKRLWSDDNAVRAAALAERQRLYDQAYPEEQNRTAA